MTLILTDQDVALAHPMEDCIESMETAFRDYGANTAVNIPRVR